MEGYVELLKETNKGDIVQDIEEDWYQELNNQND